MSLLLDHWLCKLKAKGTIVFVRLLRLKFLLCWIAIWIVLSFGMQTVTSLDKIDTYMFSNMKSKPAPDCCKYSLLHVLLPERLETFLFSLSALGYVDIEILSRSYILSKPHSIVKAEEDIITEDCFCCRKTSHWYCNL